MIGKSDITVWDACCDAVAALVYFYSSLLAASAARPFFLARHSGEGRNPVLSFACESQSFHCPTASAQPSWKAKASTVLRPARSLLGKPRLPLSFGQRVTFF